ncbi:MAG: hypothetical protein R6W06_04780 [Prochlorococcaceae cyanobacterium]
MTLPRSLGSLLAGALATALSGTLTAAAAFLAPAQAQSLIQGLEAALNSSNGTALAALLEAGPGFDPELLQRRHQALRSRFPDLRWQLSPGTPLRDGRSTVQVQVSGQRREGPFTYQLQGEQLVVLRSSGGRLSGQEVIRESTILRSGDPNLKVSLLIPDAVLTGQRYDVDAVFDDPLNGAVVAGGIAAVSPAQVASFESPELELGALGGGGLFKTVQAPFNPGEQTWAMLLVHPNGLVSATKRVRVVASKAQLNP